MKTHKIAVIASVLILPAQALLAASADHEGQAQSAGAKTTIAAPVQKVIPKKTTKPNLALPDKKQPGAIAGPGGSAAGHTQPALVIGDRAIAPIPSTPNLMVTSIGWNSEICRTTCPEVLADLRIAKATCAIEVRIVNRGGAIANSFRVRLDWTGYKGVGDRESRVKIISNMRANETRTILFTAEDLWYYTTTRPFTMTLDDFNVIQESNEGDNTKSFDPL